MSLIHSPQIITSSLIFYYDMYNTQKSWIGKPSTNYISTTPTWAGDGTDQTSFPKGATEITDPSLQYYGLKTFLWSPGAISLNCYLQSDDIVGGTSTVSTDWTFSCYVRAEDRRAITSMNVYMYFPTSDGSVAGTITYAGNDWYRISRTRSGTSSYISLAGFTTFAANLRYYLSGAMLTMDTVPVGPLNGNSSRSNTQALLDITSNNTITASSLTYNSDGTFSFNGAGNYLALPTSIGYTTTVSAFAWIKTTGTPRGGYHIIFGGQELEISIPTTGEIRTGVYTNARFVSNHGSGLTNGAWHYIGFTFDGTTKTSYIDGVSVGTQAVTGTLTSSVTGRSMGIFGQSDTTYGMNGYIANAAVYSRSLSSDEVLINFNALRGRYGI